MKPQGHEASETPSLCGLSSLYTLPQGGEVWRTFRLGTRGGSNPRRNLMNRRGTTIRGHLTDKSKIWLDSQRGEHFVPGFSCLSLSLGLCLSISLSVSLCRYLCVSLGGPISSSLPWTLSSSFTISMLSPSC